MFWSSVFAFTFFLLTVLDSSAQNAFPNVSGIMRSASGQFTVLDRRGAMTSMRLVATNADTKLIELEPPLLVVSCERIKLALCRELDAPTDWRARINITLRAGGDITLAKERLGRNWSYRVEVPHLVDRTRFIRTIVRVLLQEMADRGPGNLDAEIPPWLSEGLTQHLLASRDAELILPPPDHNLGALSIGATTILVRDPDPLETARRILGSAPTPSIEQLSWPDVNTLDSDEGEIFRRSAQLFVSELSRLKNGKENLRGMIANLNSFYNWQTAFLRAYQKQFPNQLALEKWWALQVSYFVGRDNQHLWNHAETAARLDETLRVRVAVNLQPGGAAARPDVSIQTAIREWDSVRQNIVLKEKLAEMERARIRIAPQYIRLLDEYRVTLSEYLRLRQRGNATFLGIRTSFMSVDRITREAIAALDALDTQRATISATLAKEAENKNLTGTK